MTTLVVEKRLFRTIHSLFRRFSIAPKNTFVTEYQNNSNYAEHNGDFIDSNKDYNCLRSGEAKSLKIAIIGLPNVGKSTLVNSLIKRPICATAARVHVTRSKANAIYTEDNTQLVFIDTPGLVTAHEFKKFQLEESFREDTKAAMASADLVGVVQDVTNKYTRGVIHTKILELLKLIRVGVPSVLIMNKVDEMKRKRELLKLVKSLTSEEGWPNFSDVFMVSALTSDGIHDFRNYLLASAKPSNWEYTSDMVTDQPVEKVIERVVRAKLMDSLPQEIPYRLKIDMEFLDTSDDGTLTCSVIVTTPTDRISKIVLGKSGQRIKSIAFESEQALSSAFRTNVRLKIGVKFNETK